MRCLVLNQNITYLLREYCYTSRCRLQWWWRVDLLLGSGCYTVKSERQVAGWTSPTGTYWRAVLACRWTGLPASVAEASASSRFGKWCVTVISLLCESDLYMFLCFFYCGDRHGHALIKCLYLTSYTRPTTYLLCVQLVLWSIQFLPHDVMKVIMTPRARMLSLHDILRIGVLYY